MIQNTRSTRYTIEGDELPDDDIFSPYAVYNHGWRKDDKVTWSDRMSQWDPKKYEETCLKVFGQNRFEFDARNSSLLSTFLSTYFDEDIVCTGLEVNKKFSGYTYYTFYYRNTLSGNLTDFEKWRSERDCNARCGSNCRHCKMSAGPGWRDWDECEMRGISLIATYYKNGGTHPCEKCELFEPKTTAQLYDIFLEYVRDEERSKIHDEYKAAGYSMKQHEQFLAYKSMFEEED